MNKPVIDIENPPAGAVPATVEQLVALGLTPEQIGNGEARGELKTRGPWRLPVTYQAIVEHAHFDDSKGYTRTLRKQFWPRRTMTALRQSGYELEGRVSLGGRKLSCFTSHQLFELPNGKLVNVATIFVRLAQ